MKGCPYIYCINNQNPENSYTFVFNLLS